MCVFSWLWACVRALISQIHTLQHDLYFYTEVLEGHILFLSIYTKSYKDTLFPRWKNRRVLQVRASCLCSDLNEIGSRWSEDRSQPGSEVRDAWFFNNVLTWFFNVKTIMFRINIIIQRGYTCEPISDEATCVSVYGCEVVYWVSHRTDL